MWSLGGGMPDAVSVDLVRRCCFELVPRLSRQPRLVVPEDPGEAVGLFSRVEDLQPGAIVLMRVGSAPEDYSTVEATALPQLLDAIGARGYGYFTLRCLWALPATGSVGPRVCVGGW